jgi:phosphoribosylformylglycinamidine synthase subunit PurS
MLFGVRMLVELKEGLADPQGRAIMDALPAMGWDNVPWLTAGKSFHFHVEARDEAAVLRQANEMGERLLSNPVIERFTIQDVYAAGLTFVKS